MINTPNYTRYINQWLKRE